MIDFRKKIAATVIIAVMGFMFNLTLEAPQTQRTMITTAHKGMQIHIQEKEEALPLIIHQELQIMEQDK